MYNIFNCFQRLLSVSTCAATPWLLKTIEDVYDSRYAHDVAELEYIAGGDPDDVEEVIGAHPFPEYVVSHCGYGQVNNARLLIHHIVYYT
jgi:allophanate hydrolase subunit 1